MFTKKQVKEIREHLEKAQNPIFFFDDDPDGLCSFLLMQRFIGRGKGVPIKSYPGLSAEYFRKVGELNADYIFILDKPVVPLEFFEKVQEVNIPIVWIDHHEIDKKEVPNFVNYYNPLFNRKKTNEPVTALCYQVTNKKEDSWIGVVGCISDRFVPDFYEEFMKQNPDLTIDSDDAFKIFYESEIGKIARIFSFALKDRTTNVINMIRFLMKAKSPYDVLTETPNNQTMHYRFKQIDSTYQKFLDKARNMAEKSGKVLFFQYAGELSVSTDISNRLSYLFPDKFLFIIHSKGVQLNISSRGENVRAILLEAIKDLEGATGGGHENAAGARINSEDLDKFKEKVEKLAK